MYQTGKYLSVGVIFTLFFFTYAWGGLVQIDQDGSRTLISDGRIKEVPDSNDEGWVVMNLKTNTILMVNTEQGTCTEATFEEYCSSMQMVLGGMMSAMSEFMGGQMQDEAPDVEIRKLGSGGKIAGFDTVKYQVSADGELYEELWLTHDRALMKELGNPDQDSLRQFATCMEGQSATVENDEDYIEMSTSGWPLKEISYDMGEPEVDLEVVRLEKKDIPASEFAMPAGCRKVDLEKMFGGME